jgi:hypothetical protein
MKEPRPREKGRGKVSHEWGRPKRSETMPHLKGGRQYPCRYTRIYKAPNRWAAGAENEKGLDSSSEAFFSAGVFNDRWGSPIPSALRGSC